MEILFMVFMVIVSVMALFAVMIVFRDVVQEILVARKEREATDRSIIKHAERIIAEAEAKDAAAKCVCAEPVVVAEPVAAPVVEEPYVAPAKTTSTSDTNSGIAKDYDSKYEDIWKKFLEAKKLK